MGKPPGININEIPIYMGPTGRTIKKPVNGILPDIKTPPQNAAPSAPPAAENQPQETFKKVPEGATPLQEMNVKVQNLVKLNQMIADIIRNPNTRINATSVANFKRQYQKLLDYQTVRNITDSSYIAELEKLRSLIDEIENK